MIVRPIPPKEPSFGYKWHLKTAFKKGKLPTVTRDVSGQILTADNVTIDHIIPHSKGGKTVDGNLMLASAGFNNRRGNRSLFDFVTIEQVRIFFSQFIDVKYKGFDGNQYVKAAMKTITEEFKKWTTK